MPVTTNPEDPRLSGAKDSGLNEVYLVLSEEERAKGFVRPLRYSYKHVGQSPRYPLHDLTPQQEADHFGYGYVKYEKYPESESPILGKYWTQADLDKMQNGCGEITTMGQAIAETWARDISFYSHTFCIHCNKHLPVNNFVWYGTDERMGE